MAASSGKGSMDLLTFSHGTSIDQLAANLWTFLMACEPHLREAETFDEVQDMILRLEERDDSFHKYDIVHHIRQCINDAIGAAIEDKIEKHWTSFNGSTRDISMESIVETITEEVVHSNQYASLHKMLRHEVSSAVDRLAADFDDLFVRRHDNQETVRHQRHEEHRTRHHQKMAQDRDPRSSNKKGSLIFSDNDSSSLTSSGSLTQSGAGFLFLTPDRLSLLAENLRKGHPLEMRYESLSQLSQLPPCELLGHESWPQLKPVLESTLFGDGGEEPYLSDLSERALKLYAKMLQLLNTNSKEVFISLVYHLQTLFLNGNTMVKPLITIPSLEEGVDMQKSENSYLMQRFNLICMFVCDIPAFWTRFPTKFADDVIEAFLRLLAVKGETSQESTLKKITPLHCMALVDPKAIWFVRWTHGHYSRTRLLSMLKKPPYQNVISEAALAIIEYVQHLRTIREELGANATNHPIFDSEDDPRYYSREDLEFLYFAHCLSIVTRVMSFVLGRDLFPIHLDGATIQPTTMVVAIMQLLNPTICHHGPTSFLSRPDFPSFPSRAPHPSPCSAPLQALVTSAFCPRLVAADAVREFCRSDERVCHLTMCHDKSFSLLLSPLRKLLSESSHGAAKRPSLDTDENTLLFVGDILAQLASSSVGFLKILYGSSQERVLLPSAVVSSPAFAIASFTLRALQGTMTIPGGGPKSEGVSNVVTASFLYVCRQMYKTCEGLLVLQSFDLHTEVASAWRKAAQEAREAKTPTPSDDGRGAHGGASSTSTSCSDVLLWEQSLMDNLLNFAATPNGVLLLQLTGAMGDCVLYMYSRYDQKQQVSKFEKFGYGTMVSQVATTAAGMDALLCTDFIKALVVEIWELLECNLDDDASAVRGPPLAYPLTSLDKSLVKPFRILVNFLSSFPALYELLHDCALPQDKVYSLRDAPLTVLDLLDRLVFVDSDAKIHALFNYEQSHVFGLKLLSALISSLDCLLFLQIQYGFQDILLEAQRLNIREGHHDEGIILDMLSLERNYILVKSFVIGGPNERLLPSRSLVNAEEGASTANCDHVVTLPSLPSAPVLPVLPSGSSSLDRVFHWPLFASLPVPRDYTPTHLRAATHPGTGASPSVARDADLAKHLDDFKATMGGGGEGVYENFARAFKTILSTKGHELLKGNVLLEFMELAASFMSKQKNLVKFPLPESAVNAKLPLKTKDLPALSKMQQLGIKLAVRYGTLLKIFPPGSEGVAGTAGVVESGHTLFLQQCKWVLRQHHHDPRSADPSRLSQFKFTASDGYPGHDWLASSVFLLSGGHVERSWRFLLSLAPLLAGGYLWLPYLLHGPPASMGAVPPRIKDSSIHPLFFNACHVVEMLVHIELPLVSNAVKMSGCTLASFTYRWLSQCFWNYLNWEDICQYLALCVVLGIDYQIYFCVAVVKHLEQRILSHFQEQDLVVFLSEEPIHGFSVADHLSYLFELESRYRAAVLPFLQQFHV